MKAVALTAPLPGAEISKNGMISGEQGQIWGSAFGDNFLEYRLEYQVEGEANWQLVKKASSAVQNGLQAKSACHQLIHFDKCYKDGSFFRRNPLTDLTLADTVGVKR